MSFPSYADVQAYAEACTSPPPPLLLELAAETHALAQGSQMLSSPLQGRTLALFSRLLRPQCILEIGTYTGYSALCLAEGLSPTGQLHTIDRDPRYAPLAQRYFQQAGLAARIHQHLGPALEVLPQLNLAPGTADLAFIDADKKNYPAYYELLLPLLRPGGLLIADNVLWKGAVLANPTPAEEARTTVLRNFTQQAQADPRTDNLLLPVRDGLLIVGKK